MNDDINKYKIQAKEQLPLKVFEHMIQQNEGYEVTGIKPKLMIQIAEKIFNKQDSFVEKNIIEDGKDVEYVATLYVFTELELKQYIDNVLIKEIQNEVDKRIFELKQKLGK